MSSSGTKTLEFSLKIEGSKYISVFPLIFPYVPYSCKSADKTCNRSL